MRIDMLMPALGESITEATITRWRKQVGDTVERDEMILEVATDKVDSEIPVPASGTLVEILYREGDTAPVPGKVAVIETAAGAEEAVSAPAPAGEPAPEPPEPAAQEPAEPIRWSDEEEETETPEEAPAAEEESIAPAPEEPQQPEPAGEDTGLRPSGTERVEKIYSGRFYSPLVRTLAAKYDVALSELDALPGSGAGGRFTKQDLLQYLDSRGIVQDAGEQEAEWRPPQERPFERPEPEAALAPEEAPAPEELADYDEPAAPLPSRVDEYLARDGETVIPMDNMRRAIAEHMVRSKRTSPHVYTVHEVDMTAIGRWREQHRSEFEAKEGFRLTFTPFILEATVRALIKFPYVNSSVEGQTVHLKRHVNLGCAVSLEPAGLIVPVIKKAEEKNLVGLARGLQDLSVRARAKKLLPDDVAGGTFTVTNPGVFGTLIGTPIINQPQAAILCIGAIEKRPVVIDDMIAVRSMCYFTLSYDHRVIDGATSGRFLSYIGDYLENWDMSRGLY